MKTTKSIVSVILSILLILTALTPAVMAKGTDAVMIRETRKYQNAPAVPAGIDADVDWEGVKAALRTGIIAHDAAIDISAFGVSNNKANVDYISNILYDTPQLLADSMGFDGSVSGSVIHEIYNQYIYTAEEFAAMYAACEDAVTQLLYGIKDNDALTDAEKCLLVHDRLIEWCEYDYASLLAGNVPDESHSAYGPLVLHTGVCQGISYAYDWMMDELGIEDCYVASDALTHGWNMVTLNGENYFIDNTFDDPAWDVPGYVQHDNLLLSFNTFSALHDNADDYTHSPASTLYENEWWTSLLTGVQFVNGAFRYIAPSTDGDDYYNHTHFDIVTRLPDGTETVEMTVGAKWTTASGAYYRSDNAKLISIGTKLLYALPDEIRAYDTETGEDTLVYAPDLSGYGDGFHIYGMDQQNGTLTLVISDSPNFDGTTKNNTVYYEYCTEHENRELLDVISSRTATDPGEAKYICTDCRAIFTDEAPECTHSFGGWTVTVTPTCAAGGSRTRTCALCSETETETLGKDASNHTGGTEIRNTAAATCTAEGYTGDTYCLGCGTKISEGSAISMAAHVFGEWTVTAASTCTAKGQEKRVCANCPAEETREIAIDKTKHGTPVLTKEAIAATCTAEGRTAEWSCPVCGDVLTASTTVSKTAHNFVAGARIDPTCTAAGYTVYKCSECTATENRDKVSALGHSYDADGVCVRCGEKNEEQSGPAKMSFWQKIIAFFQKIIDFFKNLGKN